MMTNRSISKNDIFVKLKYVPVGRELKLSWPVMYEKSDDQFWWDTEVNVEDGSITNIKKLSWTIECNHSGAET